MINYNTHRISLRSLQITFRCCCRTIWGSIGKINLSITEETRKVRHRLLQQKLASPSIQVECKLKLDFQLILTLDVLNSTWFAGEFLMMFCHLSILQISFHSQTQNSHKARLRILTLRIIFDWEESFVGGLFCFCLCLRRILQYQC